MRIGKRYTVYGIRYLVLVIGLLVGCGSDGGGSVDSPGRLILVNQQTVSVDALDLETLETEQIFATPPQAWVYQADVAPDGKRVALSYSEPPQGDGALFDRSGIFLLDLENPSVFPEKMLGSEAPNEYYFNPIWSPDGEWLYYVVQFADDPIDPTSFIVSLERINLETQRGNIIASDGVWPRLSADGERITYVQVNPSNDERAIIVADADGSNPVPLITMGQFFDVDTPFFSADGEFVYFIGADDPNARRSLFDLLMGVRVAEAHADHNIPSDWYRVSVNGGSPERITNRGAIVYYGDLGNEQLFFTSQEGLFSVSLSDNTVIQVLESADYRTFSWTSD